MSRSLQRKKKPNNKGRDKGSRTNTLLSSQSKSTKKQEGTKKRNVINYFLSCISILKKRFGFLIIPFVALKKPMVGISVVSSLVAAYFLFIPHIIPSIIMPQNTNFPFEIFLNITNSGYFDILDVEPISDDLKYTSSVNQPLTMYTLDPNGKLAGEKPPQIERIKPNHPEVVDLRKMFGLLAGRTESASFSITIKYNVWYFPIKLSQKHYYKLYRTVTGVYVWQETSQ